MFEQDELILLKPIFYAKNEQFAMQLADFLNDQFSCDTKVSVEKRPQPRWIITCEMRAKRDLQSQKLLLKRLEDAAKLYSCSFQGWRHTLETTTLH